MLKNVVYLNLCKILYILKFDQILVHIAYASIRGQTHSLARANATETHKVGIGLDKQIFSA